MEDKQNPSTNPAPSSDEQDPSVTTDDQQEDKGLPANSDKDERSESYRKQQSRADKARSEKDELTDRVNFLEGYVGESMKDKMVSEFINDNTKQYPNVTADDLKEFVSHPDEFERVAKLLQKKHEDISQSTLESVREVPEQSMTESEKKTALSKIKPSARSFQDYLRITSTRTRK